MTQQPTSQNLNGPQTQPYNPPPAAPNPPSGNRPKKGLPKGVKIAIAVFAALVLIGAVSTCGKSNDQAETQKPTAAQDDAGAKQAEKKAEPQKSEEELAAEAAAKAKQDATYASGTYKVGTDIPAGQYYLEGSGYFAITSDSSGSLDAIIANDNYVGNSIVDLEDGQYFQMKGTSMYPIEYAEPTSATEYQAGMYRVGVDMPAGEYKVTSKSGMGYIEVTSDAAHTLGSIVANEIVEDSLYQTVSEGQYVKLSGVVATAE